MPGTITVKGVGHVSVPPDTIRISMSLQSRDRIYDTAMEIASNNIQDLTRVLVNAGFHKEDIKTTNFNVNTSYNSRSDKNGNYRRYFEGYVVSHDLKVEFPMDTKRLSTALSAISSSGAHPEIQIAFIVKNTAQVNEDLLRSATQNARKKAEILCDASGVQLGKLISIDYSWGEISIESDTRYFRAEACMDAAPMGGIDIDPDDIDVNDTATFVWEIEQ